MLTEVVALVDRPPEELLALDVDELRASVGSQLAAASARVRAAYDAAGPRRGRPRRADLRGRDLRGAHLRGALLIACGPARRRPRRRRPAGRGRPGRGRARRHLATALFLSQPQANAMRGDAATTLPTPLARPTHWT